jgi:hypothetical protein
LSLDNSSFLQVPDPVAVAVLEVRQKHCGSALHIQGFASLGGHSIPYKAAKGMEISDINQRSTENEIGRFKTEGSVTGDRI